MATIQSGTFSIDGEAGTWAAYIEDGETVTYFSDGRTYADTCHERRAGRGMN